MDLSKEDIKTLISGAVRFVEDEKGLMPLRFTPEQAGFFLKNPGWANKIYASAGIRLDFTTDAREMKIRYTSCSGSSRKICFFDVYQDMILVQHCGTDNRELQPDGVLYLKMDGAVHRVTIYLPNLSGIHIQEMTLQDCAVWTPVKQAQKLLVFGDSITQGYDALYPSFSYISRIADHFHWELINKAVGGHIFSPGLGALPDDFIPDRIWVAYGTNDWASYQKEDFMANCTGFFHNLRTRYPRIPMYVLLPIWREDSSRETYVGTFQDACDFIRQVCSGYEGIQIIDGFTLFPHLTNFFSDHYLHPNDMGFLLMADRIIEKMDSCEKQ